MTVTIEDFPKLESPFEREEVNKEYVCVPKIKEEYRWIFDSDKVIAVEKFNGTNVSVVVENNEIRAIFNRKNRIPFFSKGSKHFMEGIYNAIDKGYFIPYGDCQVFGELCGKKINGNDLGLDEYFWFPFDFLLKKRAYKFWNEVCRNELVGKTDEEIFNTVSEVFKELWSLDYRQRHGGEKKFAEGIVFYLLDERGNVLNRCKLRRDMFSGFKGGRHKQ